MSQKGGQTHATCCANNVAICCVGMWRSFGRGFMHFKELTEYPTNRLSDRRTDRLSNRLIVRDLTHTRRRRLGRCLVKLAFLFYFGISHLFGTIQCVCPYWFRYPRQPRIWSFRFVLQRSATKCTKNYNARAQPLFCSLNHFFGDVLVAVAGVFCVRSLITV